MKERNIKATLFIIGPNVVADPEITRRAFAEGHEIANYSWTHPQLSEPSDERVTKEITKRQEAIKNTRGFTPTLMRPPHGVITGEWIEKQFDGVPADEVEQICRGNAAEIFKIKV